MDEPGARNASLSSGEGGSAGCVVLFAGGEDLV